MFVKTEEIVVQTRTQKTVFKKLMDWKDNNFESSTVKTPEFMAFAKMLRAHIKKEARENALEVVGFSTGHFYCSGFFKNTATGKFAYFSISDVRYFSDSWIDDVLLRTAAHEKDYTGGGNQFVNIIGIGKEALKITQ
ncbi:MAG: hypothetical protein KGJ11_00895 [Candidatus Omnitrophica bacterium]|nr:hypothetical protein [Candidatus Omnitrophota bacterium]